MQAVGGAALSGSDSPGTTGAAGPGAQRKPTHWATRAALAVLTATALLALLVDQGTKHLAVTSLDEQRPVRLLGGAVYLSLTRNSGAAFSMGSDYTFVFPLITIVVVGWIIVLARRLRSALWALALGLVLGGALGNLTDRLFRAPGPLLGHVVDMISVFGPYGQRFPVFNVADSCLFVGVVLAVLLEMTGRQRDGSRLRRESAPPDAGPAAAAAPAAPPDSRQGDA